MKTKNFQIPIWRESLPILFGDKSEVSETLIKEYNVEEEWAIKLGNGLNGIDGAFRAIETSKGTDYFIWLPSVPKQIKDYGVLIHELQHFVFDMLRDKGLNHTQDSDEAYSYLIEYLFCEIDTWITELRVEEEQNTNN